jgi:hypothetical protein
MKKGGLEGDTLNEFLSEGKKRSSHASWITCGLGTPFPRSALFLSISFIELHIGVSSILLILQVTKAVCVKVTTQLYL